MPREASRGRVLVVDDEPAAREMLGEFATLKGHAAVAPTVKVIMVSGTSDAVLARRTLARGAFDYVTKPVDMEHLAQSVDTAVTMKRIEG